MFSSKEIMVLEYFPFEILVGTYSARKQSELN